jgi:hypothetical protein
VRAVWLGTCSVRFPVPGFPANRQAEVFVEARRLESWLEGSSRTLCCVGLKVPHPGLLSWLSAFAMTRAFSGDGGVLMRRDKLDRIVCERRIQYHSTDRKSTNKKAKQASRMQILVKSRKKVPGLRRIWLARMLVSGSMFLSSVRHPLAAQPS